MITTTQTVELSDDDLRDAVTAWLQKKLRRKGAGEWTVSLGIGEPDEEGYVPPKVTATRTLP